MHDTAKRRLVPSDCVEHLGQRLAVGNIAPIDTYLSSRGFEFPDPPITSWSLGSSAAHECNRAGSAGDEPARRLEAKPLDPSGDEIRPVPAHLNGRRLPELHTRVAGRYEHNLSDVPGGLHQSESVVEPGESENSVGKRANSAFGQG